MENTDVMTVPEAGARLGLGRQAAYRMVQRGLIPSIKLGRTVRVPRVAFDALLAGKPQQSGGAA